MDSYKFIFAAAAIIAVVSIYNYFFNAKAKINRKLKNAVSKKIADFIHGETARIIGRINPIEEELIAPLSGRKCVHYTVLVEEERSSGEDSSWTTLFEKSDTSKIFIQDGEHCALVANEALMHNIVIDAEYSSGFLNDTDEQLEAFLKENGEKSEGFFGLNRSLRYKEGILEKGEKIAVLGKGEWKSANELDLPAEFDKVLLMRANEKHAVYLSDDPETTVVKMIEPKKTRAIKQVQPQKDERYNKRYLK